MGALRDYSLGLFLMLLSMLSFTAGNLMSVGAPKGGESTYLTTRTTTASTIAIPQIKRTKTWAFLKPSITVGVLQGIHSLAFFLSVRTLTPVVAVAILTLAPAINLLLDWSKLGSAKTKSIITFGVVTATISALALQLFEGVDSTQNLFGFACAAVALTTLVTRLHYMEKNANKVDINLALTIGFSVVFLLGLTFNAWLWIGVLWGVCAGINTWIGHQMFYRAQRHVPAYVAAMTNIGSMILTGLFAWLFFGKTLTAAQGWLMLATTISVLIVLHATRVVLQEKTAATT